MYACLVSPSEPRVAGLSDRIEGLLALCWDGVFGGRGVGEGDGSEGGLGRGRTGGCLCDEVPGCCGAE